MHNITQQITTAIILIQQNSRIAFILIALLWVIQVINFASGYRLNYLGLVPRHLYGLVGIPCHTFLHDSFSHLFFNSIPLFFLIDFVLVTNIHNFIIISISIILINSILLWLFGRKGIHIGASGLVMGYFGFILASPLSYGSSLNIILAILCLYYLSGLFFNLLPTRERVSWEGHLFGFIGGIITARYLPFIISHVLQMKMFY